MTKNDARNEYVILAEDYGYTRKKFMYYYDSFGCDFFIECVNHLIIAYLGGRVIYRNFNRPLDLATKDLDLPNFIDELWAREYNKFADEPVVENFTILEMYKKKAAKNRKNLERYFSISRVVAKKFGLVHKKRDNNTTLISQIEYEFAFPESGDELRIHYSQTYLGEYAEIMYNGERVFYCHFGNAKEFQLDFFGEFIEDSVWEEAVFGLYMSAIEEDNRQT